MNSNESPSPVEQPSTDENRLVRERYEKLVKMREAGIEPYPVAFAPTHKAASIIAQGEELIEGKETVSVAGRVIAVRSFGKAGFVVLRDATNQIQAYIKKDITSEAGFELFKKWLDVGDVVGVRGTMFITKHGELTIEAAEFFLLTKSVRPLPEKWHGLKDVEQRYRMRYVDLMVNPEVREVFRARSRAISHVRWMLDERGYMEVETPMMQAIYGGAAARPFTTHHNALDQDLYLRIAPELYLKRLIVGGYDRVYEINRNFRNEGISTRHNPEFTMLELYTGGWNYMDTLALTEEIIRDTARHVAGTAKLTYQGAEIDLEKNFKQVKILDAVKQAVQDLEAETVEEGNFFDPNDTARYIESMFNQTQAPELAWGLQSMGDLKAALGQGVENDGQVKAAFERGKTPDEVIMILFEELVEPKLIQPTFVLDFPQSLCPLAKAAPGDPATAERFEFFVAGLEMANAYSELNDPALQLEYFEAQVHQRAEGDLEAMNEIDRDYVRALEYGMPPCSGLGIGIDRMVMLLTDSASIRDVILFPLMRPEQG